MTLWSSQIEWIKTWKRVITYRRHPGFLKFNLHRWRRISREWNFFTFLWEPTLRSNKGRQRWVFDRLTLDSVWVGCLQGKEIERESFVERVNEWNGMNDFLAFIFFSSLLYLISSSFIYFCLYLYMMKWWWCVALTMKQELLCLLIFIGGCWLKRKIFNIKIIRKNKNIIKKFNFLFSIKIFLF